MSVLMLFGTDQDAEECGSSPGQLRGPRAFSADVGVEVQTLERRDPSEGRRDRPRTAAIDRAPPIRSSRYSSGPGTAGAEI
jgi:hypothetical protein